jgi:hypothetical protein
LFAVGLASEKRLNALFSGKSKGGFSETSVLGKPPVIGGVQRGGVPGNFRP